LVTIVLIKKLQDMRNLNFLSEWIDAGAYLIRRSAQSFMGVNRLAFAGSSCGSGGDNSQPSACGAGDGDKPQSSACGAGDDSQPKPSACGSGCGAGDSK
jgi:ACGX-repeat protein